jgi:hypothetical protein
MVPTSAFQLQAQLVLHGSNHAVLAAVLYLWYPLEFWMAQTWFPCQCVCAHVQRRVISAPWALSYTGAVQVAYRRQRAARGRKLVSLGGRGWPDTSTLA